MPIQWDESFSTGVRAVDDQHRELFRQVAALGGAMSQGKGRQEIGRTLDFLQDYVLHHFAQEERWMDELRCPVAAANKQAHGELLAKFGQLRARFDAAGAGPSVTIEIHDMLSKWLVEHIRRIDLRLRDWLNRPEQEKAAAEIGA